MVPAASANIAGTVTNSSQPNIRSLGNLVSLTVDGPANLGSVGNVTITGGSNGQYLRTDGNGNLSWQTISTSSISNGNSNVNISSANGNVNISSAGNANVLVVTGSGVNVAGTLNTTGNITANYFFGNAANLTGVVAAFISNGSSNIGFTGSDGNILMSVAGQSGTVTITPNLIIIKLKML